MDKTTFIELLLFRTGVVCKFGIADAGDSRLDSGVLEQRLSITIYAKHATVEVGDVELRDGA